ncbi:hypothetical protein HPB47_025291 [Ixodes persulcatus]|uniref:Uncharacterized protein n=1 Tax=Ixodes persulcatus TaxID=34615 RepID=A0AC60Q4C1_IXOPE|nr:hypothetical protein HPB47_025291 [Ixodes persulcatus]
MTWPLFVLLFATAAVWGVETAGLDVCTMDEMKVKTFLECTMSKAPAGTLELWENTKAMFNGRPPEQAVMALCKTSPTAGASLVSGDAVTDPSAGWRRLSSNLSALFAASACRISSRFWEPPYLSPYLAEHRNVYDAGKSDTSEASAALPGVAHAENLATIPKTVFKQIGMTSQIVRSKQRLRQSMCAPLRCDSRPAVNTSTDPGRSPSRIQKRDRPSMENYCKILWPKDARWTASTAKDHIGRPAELFDQASAVEKCLAIRSSAVGWPSMCLLVGERVKATCALAEPVCRLSGEKGSSYIYTTATKPAGKED